jgi:hypothetical protein
LTHTTVKRQRERGSPFTLHLRGDEMKTLQEKLDIAFSPDIRMERRPEYPGAWYPHHTTFAKAYAAKMAAGIEGQVTDVDVDEFCKYAAILGFGTVEFIEPEESDGSTD